MTGQLVSFIENLNMTPMQTLWVVIVFYIVLGCFMETLSMLITTTPLIAPILIALGFDPVWLGILITLLLETALITPPVGVNLYIVQGVRNGGSMNDVILGTLPFVGHDVRDDRHHGYLARHRAVSAGNLLSEELTSSL